MICVKFKWIGPFTFFSIIWILHTLTESASSAGIQDAALYPGRHPGRLSIAFSKVGDLSDMEQLMKTEGWWDRGIFCVIRGAFIIYKKAMFQAKTTNDIRIMSGINNCYSPFKIGSAQPLGPIDQPKQDSIVFFSKPFFSSPAKSTTTSVAGSFFNSFKGLTSSLIVIGKSKWKIETGSGKTFCLSTKGPKDEESPICMLPDFTQTLFKKPAIHVLHVKRLTGECMGNTTNLTLTFCYPWHQDLDDTEPRDDVWTEGGGSNLGGRSFKGACEEGPETSNALNETLKLFKAAITDSFDSMVITEWPGFGREKWKLELLDFIFDIAKIAIPDELVSNSYINRIRELFVYLLEKAWMGKTPEAINGTTQGGNDEDTAANDERLQLITEYDYRGLLYETEECMEELDELEGVQPQMAEDAMSRWTGINDPQQVDNVYWAGLQRKEGTNLIIEMTWLITNMVGGMCHRHFNFANNYWALYIHIVNKLYLTPVLPLWYSTIPHLDIILGGDMEMQYKKIAMCTTISLFASNSIEPFQRPTQTADNQTSINNGTEAGIPNPAGTALANNTELKI